jgi:hypothetical protein
MVCISLLPSITLVNNGLATQRATGVCVCVFCELHAVFEMGR